MKPFFSIIVPVYNVEPYLRECLDSIVNQTFSDYECICIDDGSTDGSGAILDEYAAKDKRFLVIHQINQGVSYARSVALAAARGQWIAACDPDDEVKPDWLRHFYDAVVSNDAIYFWTNFIKWKDGGTEVIVDQRGVEDADWLINETTSGNIFGAMWNKIYKRDFIIANRISFPKNRVHSREDYFFMFAYLAKRPKVKYIGVADYIYKLRKGSLTHYGQMPTLEQELWLEEEIESCLSDARFKDLIEYRRHQLKYGVYDQHEVLDADFYNLYPSIKNVNCLCVPLHHKMLFFIAAHHGRWFVLRLLNILRAARNITTSKAR